MTKLSGAEAIVRCLEREGIELVLGIPGLYSMPIFDALYRHPTIKVMTVRHEQGASFMADGYARATGKPAAVITLPGPGLTNALTGLGEAFSDSSPVLLLSTQVNRDSIDKDKGLLHELTGQYEMAAQVCKYSERIMNPEDISGAFHRAMKALRCGRPRPVQLEIPRDIQVEPFDWDEARDTLSPANPEQPSVSEQQLALATEQLAGAERPFIYAGGGVISSGASEALVALAERLGAPVLTTGMGAGSIPGDHPLWCGVAWIAGADITPLFEACDALLAVGTRFNEGMTAGWNVPLPETTIRIDIDPEELERNLPMNLKLLGDAKDALERLNQSLAAKGINRDGKMPDELAEARASYKGALLARVGATTPWMKALRDALPRNAIISADMALFWADMLSIFPMYEPRTMLFPWGYGTLGFGIPEALGAKVAKPDAPVIAIAGDGAFLFTGTELATAVQYSLNIPILVPNNDAYGMIKVQQRDQFEAQYMAVDLVNPDFVKLAEAFGAYGEKATTPGELKESLTRALSADKPTVIEIPWRWTWGREG